MLAILLFGMQGTPYIYQGQELGMTNVDYTLEDYRDIRALNHIREMRAEGYSEAEILHSLHTVSRDNARTPMQWSAAENAGFTKGKPWLRVNPNYRTINAEAQVNDTDSVYACYRALISLRKKHPAFADGRYELLLPEHEEIIAYTRTDAEEELLVICNFYDHTLQNPLDAETAGMRLLLSDYPDCRETETLRPYEARIYHRTRTGKR